MFASYSVPFKLEKEDFLFNFELGENKIYYSRKSPDEVFEKMILSDSSLKVNFEPVEPVNTPKKITTYFLIDFDYDLWIEPKANKKIYILFPIEIGVFISVGKNIELLDIVTTSVPKFTLYGEHKTGVICRYSKSDIYPKIPTVDPMYQGVMELNIINYTNSWIELKKAVFNACGMEQWHSKNMVSMRAKMKIIQPKWAETEFINKPLVKGMHKSTELYTPKTVALFNPKFNMVGEL